MIKFYGYKRCSTSRKARKWMDDHQVNYEFQDLVEQPPKKRRLGKMDDQISRSWSKIFLQYTRSRLPQRKFERKSANNDD